MTVAAVDRLVHHALIVQLQAESYRKRSADQRAQTQGHRPKPAPRRSVPQIPLQPRPVIVVTTKTDLLIPTVAAIKFSQISEVVHRGLFRGR
jgi:hypothetical protein